MTGGQAGIRGYLVQALIALLDALVIDASWVSVTLEPNEQSEKIDILWRYERRTKAVQVKSSKGQIAKGDAERWAKELQTAYGSADDLELQLVGPCSQAVTELTHIGSVRVAAPKNLDLHAFKEQAAHRLARFLESQGLPTKTADYREMLAGSLADKLATLSTSGTPLARDELGDLLRRWVLCSVDHPGVEHCFASVPQEGSHQTRDSIIFVDSNYEVLRRHNDLMAYRRVLERSLKLCLLLSKNRVLHPGPQLFENPVIRPILLAYRDFFVDRLIASTTKRGIDFHRLVTQRTEVWTGYPKHLLSGYQDQQAQDIAQALPDPIGVRTSSMTDGIESRLLKDLEECDAPESLGGSLTANSGTRADDRMRSTVANWLTGFVRRRPSLGVPIMHDTLRADRDAPTDAYIWKNLSRRLLDIYFAEAEDLYGAFACTLLRSDYPMIWRSSRHLYYVLQLLWQGLGLVGVQEPVERMGSDGFARLVYGDCATPFVVFREWYESVCNSHTSAGPVKAIIARAALGDRTCRHGGICMCDVIGDLRRTCHKLSGPRR